MNEKALLEEDLFVEVFPAVVEMVHEFVVQTHAVEEDLVVPRLHHQANLLRHSRQSGKF
jgi:hypothetical protein